MQAVWSAEGEVGAAGCHRLSGLRSPQAEEVEVAEEEVAVCRRLPGLRSQQVEVEAVAEEEAAECHQPGVFRSSTRATPKNG